MNVRAPVRFTPLPEIFPRVETALPPDMLPLSKFAFWGAGSPSAAVLTLLWVQLVVAIHADRFQIAVHICQLREFIHVLDVMHGLGRLDDKILPAFPALVIVPPQDRRALSPPFRRIVIEHFPPLPLAGRYADTNFLCIQYKAPGVAFVAKLYFLEKIFYAAKIVGFVSVLPAARVHPCRGGKPC